MTDLLHDLIFDYTLRTVALGSAVLGMVSGSLGVFAVLRRQSLVGDAMAHAALPGIVLAFMLTSSKSTPVLLIGAAIAGWLGALAVLSIVRASKLAYDTALAIVLSVFFGLGLVFLTAVQRRPDASQAGLDKFLFGQAATLIERDVITMSIVGIAAFTVLMLIWKEIKLLSFDSDYAASIGLPVRGLDIALTTLVVIAIVVGLQTVGVVLMSAMIVAPAAAARQWTDRLGIMVAISAAFGAVAGVVGTIASGRIESLPTGPAIVVAMSLIVVISILFAPQRGLLWHGLENRAHARKFRGDLLLSDLAVLAAQH
ncbi:MAG: metal ABC transporter permease, partial [Chloroflexota bacterium]|nr:metal ABC transporter permease [Chloroflexota bacterium]